MTVTVTKPMRVAMVVTIAVFSVILTLSSCTPKTDAAILSLDTKVKNYCLLLEASASIADALDKKPLLDKIDAATDSYCSSAPIASVPAAIAALATTYQAVTNAGIQPQISVASN